MGLLVMDTVFGRAAGPGGGVGVSFAGSAASSGALTSTSASAWGSLGT